MYKWIVEGLLLKCLDKSESLKVMVEAYEWVCGSHRLGQKIRWLIHRHGYVTPIVGLNSVWLFINNYKNIKGN